MRDPQATLRFTENEVIRRLHKPLGPNHFLRTPQAHALVETQQLIAFELRGERDIASARLPWITYPTEWCDSQLHDAAVLTLNLAEALLPQGQALKDASAWNVIARGTQPVFCDILSLESIAQREWWAFGQFARHFIFPTTLAKTGRLHAHESFRLRRDGPTAKDTRKLLGWRSATVRAMPLLMATGGSSNRAHVVKIEPSTPTLHRKLYATARWMLGSSERVADRSDTTWSDYAGEREHYPRDSLLVKQQTVAKWLALTRPTWVLDLGGNKGEFSEIALNANANVVVVDQDHACVDAIYRKHRGSPFIYPMVGQLDDLMGGCGWNGEEFPGFVQRSQGHFDVVMWLALIHHLAIAAAISLHQIAETAKRLSKRWAIVEWIDPTDPQVELLCSQRQRDAQSFSLDLQRQAFVQSGWTIDHELPLPGGLRTLALLRHGS